MNSDNKVGDNGEDDEANLLQPKNNVSHGNEPSKKRPISRNQVSISVIALMQGVASFPNLALSYFYKDYLHLEPGSLTLYNSINNFAWIFKPLYAFITDSFFICGYRRKSYLIIFAFLMLIGWVLMGTVVDTIAVTITIKFMINVAFGFCNVIGEGTVVEESQKMTENAEGVIDTEKRTRKASNNVSVFLSLTSLALLVTSYLSGFALEHLSVRTVFLISAFIPSLIILSAFILEEKRRKKNQESTLIEENTQQRIFLKAQLKKIFAFLKLKQAHRPLLFIFIIMLNPGYAEAMFYFYTNELKFSPEIMGRLSILSSLANIIGIFLYNRFLTKINFKTIIITSTLLWSCVSSLQFILIERLNSYIGISDQLFAMIANVADTLMAEVHLMPIMVLACRLCPKNVEASVYAFIMAIINLAYLISYQVGGFLTIGLGISSSDFTNLWILVLISVTFPIIILPILTFVPMSLDLDKEITAINDKNDSKEINKDTISV